MKVLIDADACPVVDLSLSISSVYEIETILFCDTSHRIERDNVITIMVPKGPDSVDFTLVNALSKHDIVITQDYGLAAMVLARGGYPIDQNGREMTSGNIERLLDMRHVGQKIRRAGGRTRGPKKRTQENNIAFELQFRQICERAILAQKMEASIDE
ncbi:MAG: DUF188 domain-containing protein [Lysinibacillus sp.]